MKKIIYLIGAISILLSCEDILDIKPTDMISEADVINDPILVDAFLNKIYASTRFMSGGSWRYQPATFNVVSGEQNVYAAWQPPFQAAMHIIDENGARHAADGQMEYWPYDNIRSANEILEILRESSFDMDFKIQRTAEARWLRAYMYFEMVKRYGGVPLITEPQSIDNLDALLVSRNSEKEIYDFIATEMDDLVDILPGNYTADNYGRPTRWAAYALKSRAMLYAGSIAKYGQVQINGIVGIPATHANSYYQKSYDAAIEIINNGPHPLYTANPDPVQNYNEIFARDRNVEVIFAVVFDKALGKTHGWNYVSMPNEFSTGWGSNNWFYLESFEKYEYKDGSSGKLDWSTLDGNTKFDLKDLVHNKDPRFLASAFYPEMSWQGGKVYFHSSTIGTIPPDSDWPTVAMTRNRSRTGFLIRKRINENVILTPIDDDENDWIVFRTGEMYLNAAEAAFESGDEPEARRLINIVRDRAGMPSKTVITVEDIRNERFVELFIEDHRYWDLRRWRIAVQELNGKGFHGVRWDYYIDEDKYTLTLHGSDFGFIRTFAERNYYFPIGVGRRAENPNLVENPGY
jgi:starch-binding outer membrane protein, SusD/RagB family